MALNSIILSGSGQIPPRIEQYLQEARFLEVVAVVSKVAEAEKLTAKSQIHYWLTDQETAQVQFTDLLSSPVEGTPQVLIFTRDTIHVLDRFAINPPESGAGEAPSQTRESEEVTINLDDHVVREIQHETPANTPVNVLVKADSAQFVTSSSARGTSSIFIRSESRISRIRLDELLFVEAQKDYVVFHTETGSYRTLNSMKNIQANLDENDFFRIHRSYLVRLDKIHTIQADEVLLDHAKISVPIGPSFKGKLMKRLALL
ncbi:MAG: LytTR family DNA-binding domain-containing protein [Bacteroidota bacterium]